MFIPELQRFKNIYITIKVQLQTTTVYLNPNKLAKKFWVLKVTRSLDFYVSLTLLP